MKTNSREWKSFFLSRGENSFFENEFYRCFWEIFHEIDRSDQLFVARFICYEFGVEKLARVKRFLALDDTTCTNYYTSLKSSRVLQCDSNTQSYIPCFFAEHEHSNCMYA